MEQMILFTTLADWVYVEASLKALLFIAKNTLINKQKQMTDLLT
jgi:hypothetical protein